MPGRSGRGNVRARRPAEIDGNAGEYGGGECMIAPAAFIDGYVEGGCR